MGKTMASLGFVLAMLGIGAGLNSCAEKQATRQIASENAPIKYNPNTATPVAPPKAE